MIVKFCGSNVPPRLARVRQEDGVDCWTDVLLLAD
jgi:hypothetical protein